MVVIVNRARRSGGAVSPPGQFDPTNYGNLAFWLDPAQLPGADGSAVGSAPNLGNALGTLQQATESKKPTLQTVAGRRRLKFDGVDDALSLASLNLTGTDKLTVVVKGAFRAVAGDQVFLEASDNYNVNDGAFIMYKTAAQKLEYSHSTPGTNSVTSTSIAVDTDVVMQGTSDRSLLSGEVHAYLDGGASGTPVVNDNTTGNYANYPLYLGGRAGTSLFSAIDLGDVLIYRGVLSAQQLSNLRADLASR